MRRAALVISGGGAKGAFAVGVVKSLYRRFGRTGWFSITGGSSAGGLIAPFAALLAAPGAVAGEALDVLEEAFTHVVTSDILARQGILEWLRRRDCFHESDPLRRMIGRNLRPVWFDWLQSGEAPDCYVVYTNFRTGRKVVVSPRDPGMDRERFILCMLASASVPVLMEPTIIDGEECFDGGVRDLLPCEPAIERGAEVIVPILLDPPSMDPARQPLQRVDRILARTLSILMDETGANDLQYARLVHLAVRAREQLREAFRGDETALARLEEGFGRAELRELFGAEKRLADLVHGLRPDRTMTEDYLTFEPDRMHRWLVEGERKAAEVVRCSPFTAPDGRRRPAAAPAGSGLTEECAEGKLAG